MQSPLSMVRRKNGVKALILLLTVLLLAISLGQAVFGAPDVTFGDVNDDGKIDVRDVVMVMQHILVLKGLDNDQIKAADVTGDGKIDVNDVNQIMQYILGIIDRFTVHSSIKSIEEVEIDVSYGTAQDNIGFPEEVEITLYDNSSQDVSVKWGDTSTPEYQRFMSGHYVFTGELDQLPQDVFNPKELKATAVVSVGYQVHQPQPAPPPPDEVVLITGLEVLAAIVVSEGTNFADIGLPSEVEVTFDDDSTSMLDVDWLEGVYDGDTPGDYDLEGELVLEEGQGNPDNLKAEITVTVEPAALEVVSVVAITEMIVEFGTLFADLPLPEEVEVTLDDNSTMDVGVDWLEGVYDGDVAGTYTLEGDLVLPVGVVNPYDHTASVDVTVRGENDNVYNVEKEEWYENISSTIVAADPDNTLLVYPGTYAEAVTIATYGLTLKSANGPGETVIESNAAANASAVSVEAEGVTIEGFTIDNLNGGHAINLGWETNYAHGATIKDNVLTNSIRGTYVAYNNNVTLIGNIFETEYGVTGAHDALGLHIFGNTFNTTSGEAIGLGDGVQLVDADGVEIPYPGDVEWLENNNTFAAAQEVVDYRGPVYNSVQRTSHATIQAAIDDANAGDTLLVGAGEYVEVDQIVINKNLSIIGVDKNTTIIKPAQDTGSTGDARGWFLVEAGNEFNLSNVTLDGEGKNVHQAIRSNGSGTIDNNLIKNIKYSTNIGLGMVGMTGSDMTFSNNTFTNIERIGMMAFGTGATAEMIGNTYTGKGSGDFLDYGIEIGGGASATITGNTITNCGPSTTVWVSAGIFLNSLYAAPGEVSRAVITDNTLTNNENGIIVGDGVDTPDEVVANFNNISGNSWGLRSYTAIPLDATDNWWGHESGPGGEGPGVGDKVSENVIYDPWADSPF